MEQLPIVTTLEGLYDFNKKSDEIASGASGIVYNARDIINNRNVALKIMKEGDGEDKITQENLVKEYNLKFILGEDCEKHLVCYYDVFKLQNEDSNYDERLFLAMTLITGNSLDKIFSDMKLTSEEKYKITNDLLIAIYTLHSHEIAHRDIKLENVVYDKDNNNTVLLDYGVSCSVPKFPITLVKECNDNKLYGTKNYVDPDINQSVLDGNTSFEKWEKADLYSLGATLFSLWFEVHFHFGVDFTNPDKTQYAIKYLYEHDIDSEYNSQIKELIFHLLSKDKSMEEIIQGF